MFTKLFEIAYRDAGNAMHRYALNIDIFFVTPFLDVLRETSNNELIISMIDTLSPMLGSLSSATLFDLTIGAGLLLIMAYSLARWVFTGR